MADADRDMPAIGFPALLFVAHWDDEVLSAAGLLQRCAGDWTILAATIREEFLGEPWRYDRVYQQVCGEMGAVGYTLPIRHRRRPFDPACEKPSAYVCRSHVIQLTPDLLKEHLEEMIGDPLRFATVVTHGPDGEPGHHSQHRQVSSFCEFFWGGRAPPALWCFSTDPAEVRIELTDAEYARKVRWMNLYKPEWPAERAGRSELFSRAF